MLEFANVDVAVAKTTILKNISVSFEKGKVTSIVGPNGCGKTTLLQTLNGASKVTTGKILIDGVSYFDHPLRERAKQLSFMPQLRNGAPVISVKGLVEHGRFPYMGFSRKMSDKDREIVEKAIEFTGLTAIKECMVNELSGGQQQRAYLAMQLAQDSEYMVMDEPMNYLDIPGQKEFSELIESLGHDGRTVIVVMHDLDRAIRISDNIVVMKDRSVVFSGTPVQCLEGGTIDRVFDCDMRSVEVNGIKHYVFL